MNRKRLKRLPGPLGMWAWFGVAGCFLTAMLTVVIVFAVQRGQGSFPTDVNWAAGLLGGATVAATWAALETAYRHLRPPRNRPGRAQ
jgi:hypothetical protein